MSGRTMLNSCAINALNPVLKGTNEVSHCVFFCFSSSSFLPLVSPLLSSIFLSTIHPFFQCSLHNGAAFTFNSQRSWGRTEAGFRHNCQSTYPPTYRWLQSLTVPWRHTFPCIYVMSFSVDVCIYTVYAYREKNQQQHINLPIGSTTAGHVSDVRYSTACWDYKPLKCSTSTHGNNIDKRWHKQRHMHECTNITWQSVSQN